jgi:hypothetical protein
MQNDDFLKQLENLDLPQIELPTHQRRLKMALLNSGYWEKQPARTRVKKVVPVGTLVAVLAIAGIVSFTGPPSQVSAQDIAQKSYERVVSLPADQQAKVSAKLRLDSRTILQEAYNAKDLKALTYEEYVSSGPVPPDPEGKLHTLQFLQFTKPDGATVTLGIDPKTNLPVFSEEKIVNPSSTGAPGEERLDIEPGAEVSGQGSFSTHSGDGKRLVMCTVEKGVEKCTEVNE